MHRFPENINPDTLPDRFTDPSRYCPHPLVVKAAEMTIARIDNDSTLKEAFAEGKMMGVLVVEKEGRTTFLAGFSGIAGGMSRIEGFVPPIYDLTEPDGHFKRKEAEISQLNRDIEALLRDSHYVSLEKDLQDAVAGMDKAVTEMKLRMEDSRRRREEIRKGNPEAGELERLTKESQHEKAGLRRLKQEWVGNIEELKAAIRSHESKIGALKSSRAAMSDALQDWIFRQYIVHNASGEEASIADIFAAEGLVPPGGTGDCAAPKLLEHAYRNGYRPVAMGEFWYGRSPETAVRTHGHFYPSCTSKCGPLLRFMLRGLNLIEDTAECIDIIPEIIYEDQAVTVVAKPAGMPSVPGLDGKLSLQEWLADAKGMAIHTVHRLDMDTSGIMVFAHTEEAALSLRRQFEEHTVRKTYTARLAPPRPDDPVSVRLEPGSRGAIDLPLSPDYDERPRQKVDMNQGKPALTEYEVKSLNPDGTVDIIFHPVTGRTHQLRVHSAHTLGLGRPILGDRLYGGAGSTPARLHLHASAIIFKHPISGKEEKHTNNPTY